MHNFLQVSGSFSNLLVRLIFWCPSPKCHTSLRFYFKSFFSHITWVELLYESMALTYMLKTYLTFFSVKTSSRSSRIFYSTSYHITPPKCTINNSNSIYWKLNSNLLLHIQDTYATIFQTITFSIHVLYLSMENYLSD